MLPKTSCLLVTTGLFIIICTLLVQGHPTIRNQHDKRSLSIQNESLSQPDSLSHDIVRKIALALYEKGEKTQDPLNRKFFHNENVTCNDGSVAGYYLRRNYHSKRWIVFLEGGWICHDEKSCEDRSSKENHRMSSDWWPLVKTVGGILSADPQENPHFHEANHVFVPYCSSDSWSGTKRSILSRQKNSRRGQNNFLGGLIVREVIHELAEFEGLLYADELYLGGSSAGATGVLINVDSISDMVASTGLTVRGIVDSGWFLDNDPFKPECNGGKCPSVIDSLKKGVQLWKARVPQACKDAYPEEPWKCYLGYKAFPFIKTPLFIFQWQFDKFQLYADNVPEPTSKAQWEYVHSMGARLRNTLNRASFVFAPACISHEILTKPSWTNIQVNDVTLPDALNCWAESLRDGIPKAPKKTISLVRHPVHENTSPQKDSDDNDIVYPVEMHSQSASMLSDAPQSYKLASNFLKSLPPSRMQVSAGTSTNSIASYFESSRNHRKLNSNRRNHMRNNRRRKNHAKCKTESNSCNNFGDSSIKSMVRSLDRRSSRGNNKKGRKNGKKRKRNKGKRNRRKKNGKKKLRKSLKNSGSHDEKDPDTSLTNRRSQKKAKKKRKKRLRRKEKRRKRGKNNIRELEKVLREAKSETNKSDAVVIEKGQSSSDRRHHHHLNVRSVVEVPTSQSSFSFSQKSKRRISNSHPICRVNLIDTCTWPHCNPTCPKLENPKTGVEIDVLMLLKSFGMDMRSVAKAFGTDIKTLNNMDKEVLRQKLTSQQGPN